MAVIRTARLFSPSLQPVSIINIKEWKLLNVGLKEQKKAELLRDGFAGAIHLLKLFREFFKGPLGIQQSKDNTSLRFNSLPSFLYVGRGLLGKPINESGAFFDDAWLAAADGIHDDGL